MLAVTLVANMKVKYTLILCLGLIEVNLFGHEQVVHEAITLNAAASALDFSSGYSGFINTIISDCDLFTATNAMRIGSFDEDFASKEDSVGGNRSFNHFYDPLTGLGLSEIPPDIRATVGLDSLTWASISNCPGYDFKGVVGLGRNVNTHNVWSWQNARSYEWLGLTATNRATRNAALTNMFRAVGQVVHLLEDTTQPQHVRNEQHLDQFFKGLNTPWHSPIEKYGKEHLNQLYYLHDILDWRGAGFTKLEDFWDRHLYHGDPQALDDDETGVITLGLAEWCNGNFLGDRHLFPEYFKPGDIEYYPFPSRNHSTDYNDARLHPENHISDFVRNGQVAGKAIYVRKTGDGVTFDYLARINYLGAKLPHAGLKGAPFGTIRDENVLEDYHDQFIPKAVQYSAGLLDYYFRGRIGVTIGLNTNTGQYTFTNSNLSGQSFLGGTFYLYQQDASGNRTLLQQASLGVGEVLTNRGSFAMDFTNAVATNVDLYVVYRGTIGETNGAASDPVDANIAIATGKFGIYPYANEAFIYQQCAGSYTEGNDWGIYIWNPIPIPAGIFYSAVSVEDANNIASRWATAMYQIMLCD